MDVVRFAAVAILGWFAMASQDTGKAFDGGALDAGRDAPEDFAEPLPAPPESETRTLAVEGRERSYLLHVPANYNAEKPIPLVLAFHGRLGTGRLTERLTGFSRLADRGFIVVYPNGIGRSWNAGHGVGAAEEAGVDDVGFIAALIAALSREFHIDRHRIYAAGMSNGGIFAYRLACDLPGTFAAVASVAGPLPPEIAETCGAAGTVSVLHIHGAADRIVPWDGGETSSGGKILSVDATVQKWVEVDRCSGPPAVTLEKGSVTCRSYRRCEDTTEVTLCRVEGGGHTWPGSEPSRLLQAAVGHTNQDVNATEMIWEFFSRHTLAAGPRRPVHDENVPEPALDVAR